MFRVRFLPIVLAVCATSFAGEAAWSQAAPDASATGLKIKIVPAKVPPMPFPPGSETPGRVRSIEFISAGQLSEKDKLLEADAESSIQERTHWADMDFNQGKWSHRQLLCPALPNHMFLQFTRNNGTGDVSVFSASIPRNGEGRVRIIPIQRRGYSLFSPAPINAMTISAFNHIRAEEHADRPPDWLTTGLCYAALAGAHPETVLYEDTSSTGKEFPAAPAPIMQIPKGGGAVIRFADVAASPRPMLWTMTFNGSGKLLKATHSPAPLITAKAVTPASPTLKVKQIPQTIVDLNPNSKPE
ncbi:MAG: hypothetical protein WBE76_05235 [Terracidiphilus sp.]